MNPSEKLKEIEEFSYPYDYEDEWKWLIERVKKLTKALEWYAKGSPWDDRYGNITDCAKIALEDK